MKCSKNPKGIVDSNNEYSYTYDETGIRTSKTVNGITTYFNTKDGIILSQTDGTKTKYFQYKYDEWGALDSITTMNNISEEKCSCKH